MASPYGRASVAGRAVLRWCRSHRRLVLALAIVVMLGQMAVAALTAARDQSPVVDEPVYVGAAVAYVQLGDLQVNPEHPPLAKLVSAIGLWFTDAHIEPNDPRDSQWRLGDQVLYANGSDANRILGFARVPMIGLTLLFGLVVFAFARDLFGDVGALVALALYAFSPDVIAHGSLATNDVPVAGFLLTTMWLLWRSRLRPRLYLPLAGLAYGCALATKMTALTLLPVVVFLAGLAVWTRAGRPSPMSPGPGPEPGPGRPGPERAGGGRVLAAGALAGAGVGALALATVWAAYLWIDPSLRFLAPPRGAEVTGLARTVVDLLPLPAPYRGGLLYQLSLENETYGGYLFGERFTGGRWYYLPAALLIKTPLGAIALWLAGVAALLAVRRLRPVALYLLLPIAILLPIAMTGGRSFGVRYVIWVPIFCAVAAGAAVAVRRRWAWPVVAALVLFVAVSSLRTFPYYLPYSNEAFGGPAQTYRHLNDANVDWGQDLKRLGNYLKAHPSDEPVWLLYKGRGNPRYYGIVARDPTTVPPEEVHGILAVSVMRLSGAPDAFAPLIGGREPIAVIGHTIRVYRIP